MLDPIILFIQNIFSAIGRGIGYVIAWILFPFMSAGRWYASRGFILKGLVGVIVVLLVIGYGYFIVQTQVWSGFDPDYPAKYKFAERRLAAGKELPGEDPNAPKKCQPSAIAEVSAGLIDMEINQNTWITSTPLYKMGFFGLDWDNTPWLDNKASFQRGVNQAVRRTSIELVDRLARIRGTSGINAKLQAARSAILYDETAWYVNLPFSIRDPAPKQFESARQNLLMFNAELASCQSIFDGRTDNLMQFVDNMANDLGTTADMLAARSKNYNSGWFDTRADDRYWFAYGQLYGYYGVLSAARADFGPVIQERNIAPAWQQMLDRFRAALNIQPAIISNGREDGWIMPNHLSTQGFYLLNARTSLTEIRDVLDR